MDDFDDPPSPTLAELQTMLDESRADVAAGRTVPLADVLADLAASSEQLERSITVKAHDAS